MLEKPRILFTAWNALSAIEPAAGVSVGGLETFAWSLASALAETGEFEVEFCVRVPRVPRNLKPRGVTLVPIVDRLRPVGIAVSQCLERRPGFPWIRLKRWNFRLIWQLPVLVASRLLRKKVAWESVVADVVRSRQPDLILSLGVSQDTAASVQASQLLGIPVIIWFQNNCDLDEQFFTDDTYRDRYGVTSLEARICLHSASAMICQTQTQFDLAERHGLQSPRAIIRNPIDLVRFTPGGAYASRQPQVLWIGRYDRFHKRPMLALEIARLCPEIPFVMVINAGVDPTVEADVRGDLPPNVTLIDYVPHSEMPQHLRESRLLLCTGAKEYEGFPNVFLEAAAVGTPVATLADFDQFIELSGCGICSQGDLQQLAAGIRRLWESPAQWEACSESGKAYVQSQHALPQIVARFQQTLQEFFPTVFRE